MYIESVPNRDSPPAVLLRESFREDGKVRKRTLANLSCLSAEVIEGLKVLLRGGVAVPSAESVFTVERSVPHGHVAAVLGAARGSGSSVWFGSAPKDLQPVLQAMLVARVLEPASKLATHRMLHDDTATSSLGRVLGVGQCSADDLYRALDWLHDAQAGIERGLARQHLLGSTLVLYDLTSTWLTGRCCELAARGHSRDGKRDDPQIVFGLVCTAEGCPISVEVFKGNTADPATVGAQVVKLKERFGIERIAWAGDRGMLTSARIEQVLKPQGMDWVSSLRAPQIAQLAAEHGPFQPSLFDERNLLELTSQHFPDERLVVCRNPLLAEERARKRLELLAATETDLTKIAAATQRARNPLRGEQAIALRVGRVVGRFHMARAPGADNHGHRLVLGPQGRRHRRGGRTGWPVRDPHQSAQEQARCQRGGGRLQELGPRGAGLPFDEDGGPERASDLPLHRAAGTRACLPVHAGLLRGVAHARAPQTHAVRRRAPRRSQRQPRLARGQGRSIRTRQGQGREQAG